MMTWLRRHFAPTETDNDFSGCDRSYSVKKLLPILLLWMALWTIWPSLCIGNVSIDVAENVAWGQNFAWGYDKNPYFGAWLSYAVFRLLPSGTAEYFFYLMSQLAAATGLFSVYLLARDIFERNFPAFILVPLAFLIPFFGHSACEFNDDVLSIALYGSTALFFHRGIRTGAPRMWIAAGICAGLAVMTKYLAGILLLPLAALVLLTEEGRACLKKPWIYLGMAVFALLVLPNVIWLFEHDFIAIGYAFGRADLDDARRMGVGGKIFMALDVWLDLLERMILPVLAIMIFRRGAPAVRSRFDRAFVLTVALAPTLLSSLFALVTGGCVLVGWTTPFYVFSTLLVVMLYRPVPEPANTKIFAGFMAAATLVMVFVFGYEYGCRRPYRKSSCVYNTYPGRRIAERLTSEWRRRFGTPCPYVIGDRRTSCNMCFYSGDHPTAFFDHDLRLSPWISPDGIAKKGAVVIWRRGEPEYLKRYPALVRLDDMEYDREVPAWLRRIFGRPPAAGSIHAALIPPAR